MAELQSSTKQNGNCNYSFRFLFHVFFVLGFQDYICKPVYITGVKNLQHMHLTPYFLRRVYKK